VTEERKERRSDRWLWIITITLLVFNFIQCLFNVGFYSYTLYTLYEFASTMNEARPMVTECAEALAERQLHRALGPRFGKGSDGL